MLNLLNFAFFAEVTFADVMSKIGSILLAFVILLFMITVHELGHYTAGRLLNFKINEFLIGFGPKLFSRKNEKREEVFSVRLIPLGGACVFEGEDEDNHNPQAFNNQKPWKRIIVLISGALFNLICALIIAVIFFSCFGERMFVVQKVDENSPNFGIFEVGDILVSVDGEDLYMISNLREIISKADETMTVKVLRPKSEYMEWKQDDGKDYLSVSVTDLTDGKQGDIVYLDITKGTFQEITNNGTLADYEGWGIVNNFTSTRFKTKFFPSIGKSFHMCFETGTLVIKTLGKLLTGAAGLDEVGGPITIIGQTSQVVQSGFANVLYLIILISVNLAVFNLLPIPALDGMRVIFVLIEMIFRKPVNRKVEAVIHLAGIIFLLGFAILVDVLKWF